MVKAYHRSVTDMVYGILLYRAISNYFKNSSSTFNINHCLTLEDNSFSHEIKTTIHEHFKAVMKALTELHH